MKLDVYSLCPGGQDKKVKFCCHDLLPVLDDIQSKLDADQPHSALQALDRQLAKTPERACLHVLRMEALQETQQIDSWLEAARSFRETHPENPVARACAATACLIEFRKQVTKDLMDSEELEERIRQTDEVCRRAVQEMQRAWELSPKSVHYQMYEQHCALVPLLLRCRRFAAAREHLFLAARLSDSPESPVRRALDNFLSDPNIGLLQKFEWQYNPYPGEVTWKTEFDAAQRLARRGNWQQAFEKLEALWKEHGDDLILLRNLAQLAQTLVMTEFAVQLLNRISQLTDDPLEAVETQALAIDISSAAGHYAYPLEAHELELEDGSTAFEMLLSHPRISARELAAGHDLRIDGSRPKCILEMLDRVRWSSRENQDPTEFASSIQAVYFFGKETDRPARLSWTPTDDLSSQQTIAILRDALGALWREPQRKLDGWDLVAYRLPRRTVLVEHRDQFPHLPQFFETHASRVFLEVWPNVPQPALESLTPREAVAKPEWIPRVQALLCLIENCESGVTPEDIETLRSRFGLPNLSVNLPPASPIHDTLTWRLARTDYSGVSSRELTWVYFMASKFSATVAMEKICHEILRREPHTELIPQDIAYSTLSQIVPSPEKACELLQKAQVAAVKRGESSAVYMLRELEIYLSNSHLARDETIRKLVMEIKRRYGSEPGIMEALVSMLDRPGILRPDRRSERRGAEAVEGSVHTLSGAREIDQSAETTLVGSNLTDLTESGPSGLEKRPSLWLPGQD